MKKNWKQFWTLDRHHAEGFTLVELIVVIAILAILSAVAVPAYSGYITKTHKTNDQKLVSEVSDALQLYYYANPNANAAWVVLTPDGAYADETCGTQAMLDVFGAGWESNALSYKNWGESDSGLVSNAMQNGDAVLGSSFLQGSTSTELLANVSTLTTAASGFVGQISNPTLVYSGMVGNFASSPEEFEALCQQYGIETVGEGSNKQFAESVTDTQISNLMVAAAAKDIAENDGGSTVASTLVLQYATYAAAVNSTHANDADKAAYDRMNADLQTATSVADVERILSEFQTSTSTMWDNYTSDPNMAGDIDATMALLGAVNSAAGTMSGSDLADANLFTTGKGATAFNTYLSAAEQMAALNAAFPSGIPANSIALFLDVQNGTPVILPSNAEAYLQG